MSKIYWDSMLYIYWIEENAAYAARVRHILKQMKSRGDDLYASPFVLGEVLAGPQKKGATELVSQIESFFDSSEVELIPFDSDAAVRYSQMRAQMNVGPLDAIHLACAATEGMDLFMTNDHHLVGKKIPGIQFIVGLNTNLF